MTLSEIPTKSESKKYSIKKKVKKKKLLFLKKIK
jgi:hypothetical protein